MNTKEAICFLEHDIKLFPHKAESLPACLEIYKCAERIEEVVKLLNRGEIFEAMWNDLWEGLEFKPNKDLLDMNYDNFVNYMKDVKQKYFPRGG